jgi:hypothetical protein
MRGDSSIDITVVICPVPPDASAREAATWIAVRRSGDVPVTWAIPVEMLAALREEGLHAAAAPTPPIAVDLSATWPLSRQAIRQAVRAARRAWPEIESASILGDVALDHRDVLVQEGITTVLVERLDTPARGSRRPAPRGWACRSQLWGLWEVAIAPGPRSLVSRVAGWCRPRDRGRLQVWHAGQAPAAVVRTRLERHLARVRRHTLSGKVRAIGLPELPSIITGGDPSAERGSVLRAA